MREFSLAEREGTRSRADISINCDEIWQVSVEGRDYDRLILTIADTPGGAPRIELQDTGSITLYPGGLEMLKEGSRYHYNIWTPIDEDRGDFDLLVSGSLHIVPSIAPTGVQSPNSAQPLVAIIASRAEFEALQASSAEQAGAVEREITVREAGDRMLADAVDWTRGFVKDQRNMTAGIGDVGIQYLGDRPVSVSAVSFDLEELQGEYMDSGLQWRSGGQLANQVAFDREGSRFVSEWSFDLDPLRGYDIASGMAFPAPGAAMMPQMQVAVVSAGLVHVYIRQFGNTYVRWALQHDTVPQRNADVWRVGPCRHVERVDGEFVDVREITFDGEVDVAVLLEQSSGVDKPDFMGGAYHGNEELRRVCLLVNGAALDPDQAVGSMIDADRVEILQASDMFEPGDTKETVWSPKGPLVMRHYKRLILSRDGWFDQMSYVEHVIGGFKVSKGYFGLVCLDYGTRGYNTVNRAARAPKWEIESLEGADYTETETTSDNMIAWGDDYGGEVHVIKGWTAPGRAIRLDRRADRAKIYVDYFHGETTDVTVPWDIHTRYRITVKEPS